MGDPLFEIISEDEFRKQNTPRTKRGVVTEPRLQTIWFALPTSLGFCTIPAHNDVQQMLKPEQKPYRQAYPTRHVFEISPGVFVCRDCFLMGADKEC
jgi:hypothetical protein